MAKPHPSRRGRCPHRPAGSTIEQQVYTYRSPRKVAWFFGRACFPSSVTPYGVPPSPWGKASSRRGLHSSGPGFRFQGSPPHPARATPGPPSPSRRGLPPGGGTFIGACSWLRGPLLFLALAFFGIVWYNVPKIGKRQVERGAFSVQSQDPAGHYGVLCEAPEPMAPG